MSDSYGDPQQRRTNSNGSRERNSRAGGRPSFNREGGGGFRIRLSDNEMRAVRTIQETFNLRSTVAVLGFAVRTLAQMIDEGKLNGIIEEYKNQQPTDFKNSRNNANISYQKKFKSKPNPFARPSKPQQINEEAHEVTNTSVDNEVAQKSEEGENTNENAELDKNE